MSRKDLGIGIAKEGRTAVRIAGEGPLEGREVPLDVPHYTHGNSPGIPTTKGNQQHQGTYCSGCPDMNGSLYNRLPSAVLPASFSPARKAVGRVAVFPIRTELEVRLT
jgi:hypothetical protein